MSSNPGEGEIFSEEKEKNEIWMIRGRRREIHYYKDTWKEGCRNGEEVANSDRSPCLSTCKSVKNVYVLSINKGSPDTHI